VSIHSSQQMGHCLITEDHLVHNHAIISHFSQEVATEVISLHFVCGFQLLQNLQLIWTEMKVLPKNFPDSCFQYVKFLTGTVHRFVRTTHKQLSNGFSMLCTYRWSAGAFAFTHTDISNKTLAPSTN
jgi:hypothetical protein